MGSIEELISEFEKRCPKCGADGNGHCDYATAAMYHIRDTYETYKALGKPYDENIDTWAAKVLMSCGNGQCGSALGPYLNMKHYLNKNGLEGDPINEDIITKLNSSE